MFADTVYVFVGLSIKLQSYTKPTKQLIVSEMDVEYYISPLGSISSVHLMCSFFVTLPFFYFSGQDNKAEPPCTLGHADRDRSPLKDLLHHFLMVRSL